MNRSWNDRIRNMEVAPPKAAWDNIASRLETDSYQWKNKVYHAEVTAPSNAWNNIEAALEEETQPARVVPMYTRYVRLAVAAALLIAVAVIGLMLYKNDKPATIASTVPSTKPATTQTDLPGQKDNTRTVAPALVTTTDIAANNSTTTPAKTSVVKTITQNNTARLVRSSSANITPEASGIGFIPAASHSLVNDDHYSVVTDNNGNKVKVSNKLCSAIKYLDNNNACEESSYLDMFLSNCSAWKITFNAWRDKMLTAPAIPTADNFMGILDFTKAISEEK